MKKRNLLLKLIYLEVEGMSAQLDQLKAEVTRATTVAESAVALINGLAAKIEQLKTDPVALQALADELKADTDKLSAAVEANTPPAPPAPTP